MIVDLINTLLYMGFYILGSRIRVEHGEL